MDSSAIWGKIARAIGKATASAIWPTVSAILSQLHENPCDYLIIIYSIVQRD